MGADAPRRHRLRLALDIFITVAAATITGCGIAVAAFERDGDHYLHAPECATPAEALYQDCSARIDVTVVSVQTLNGGKLAPHIPQVTLTWDLAEPHRFTLTIPQPTAAYYALKPGERVQLKVWNGIPTAVYEPGGGAVRTDVNPLTIDSLHFAGGLLLIAVGLILLAVHSIPALRESRVRPHRLPRTVDDVSHLFRDLRLRVALVCLIALNFLDIATSIMGDRADHHTFEANPVAAQMWLAWGPLGGFFALKLPALLAIILAMTRVPRRVALLLAYTGCAVMAFVVLDNVHLVLTGSPIISG